MLLTKRKELPEMPGFMVSKQQQENVASTTKIWKKIHNIQYNKGYQ